MKLKRMIALTAAICMTASLTACASKSRRNRTIETQPPAEQGETAAVTEEATTEAMTEAYTLDGTLEFDEDLDEALVGTWKFCYDDELDAYYVIDPDHSMMSMVDLSKLMHINDGKLVLGEENDPSSTFSFKEKNDHLVAKVEKKVILDIAPKGNADTEEVQGDFDLYESLVIPQDETTDEDSKSDDEEDGEEKPEKIHPILRFLDDKTYLIDLGVCYSSDGEMIFMTSDKRLVMQYKFDKDDPDTMIVTDEEGSEIRLERSTDLDEEEDEDDDE